MKDRTLNEMLRLMAPLILCNILQQFYNTIDALVLGRFADENAFAAVGIASSVMNLFLFAIVGACSGLSVLFSQYYGSGDRKALRNEHYLTTVLGLAGSALLAVIGIAFLDLLMQLIHVPGTLVPDVRAYLVIVLAALPAAYLYNLYSAILRSVSKTGAILLILAACVALNLLMDVVLVKYLALGIRGAAIATAAAEALSAMLGFIYLGKEDPELLFHRADMHISRTDIRKTACIASVTTFHQAGLYIGKLMVQGIINSAGTSMIAAYTATTRIEGFANSFGDSGATAASVLTGHAYGAGDKKEIRHTFIVSLFMLAAVGILMSLIMYVSASAASAFLIGSASGKAYDSAVSYLRMISFFYVFCFIGNTYAGWFDGIGKVKIPFIGAASHITMRIIFSYIMISRLGLPAVAIASGIGWIWVCVFWETLRRKFCRIPADTADPLYSTGV